MKHLKKFENLSDIEKMHKHQGQSIDIVKFNEKISVYENEIKNSLELLDIYFKSSVYKAKGSVNRQATDLFSLDILADTLNEIIKRNGIED